MMKLNFLDPHLEPLAMPNHYLIKTRPLVVLVVRGNCADSYYNLKKVVKLLEKN